MGPLRHVSLSPAANSRVSRSRRSGRAAAVGVALAFSFAFLHFRLAPARACLGLCCLGRRWTAPEKNQRKPFAAFRKILDLDPLEHSQCEGIHTCSIQRKRRITPRKRQAKGKGAHCLFTHRLLTHLAFPWCVASFSSYEACAQQQLL